MKFPFIRNSDIESIFIDGEEYLTIALAASRLGVSRQRVHALVQRGYFPGVRRIAPRGRFYIPVTDIRRYKER